MGVGVTQSQQRAAEGSPVRTPTAGKAVFMRDALGRTVPADHWTAADQAELDLRIRRLVDHCATAETREQKIEAIDWLIEWREQRAFKSRAEGLRRDQLAADLALERRARWTIPALVHLVRETSAALERARRAA